jgi:hypothetical protein
MSFHSEIYSLKEALFDSLLDSDGLMNDPSEETHSGTVLKCPLLVMTATTTKAIVDQFTLLSGI